MSVERITVEPVDFAFRQFRQDFEQMPAHNFGRKPWALTLEPAVPASNNELRVSSQQTLWRRFVDPPNKRVMVVWIEHRVSACLRHPAIAISPPFLQARKENTESQESTLWMTEPIPMYDGRQL